MTIIAGDIFVEWTMFDEGALKLSRLFFYHVSRVDRDQTYFHAAMRPRGMEILRRSDDYVDQEYITHLEYDADFHEVWHASK